MYVHLFAVAPSVTDVVAVLDTPNQYRDMHSATVTCTIHPESEAELCEAVLIAPGNLTRIGKVCYATSYMLMFIYVGTYVHAWL